MNVNIVITRAKFEIIRFMKNNKEKKNRNNFQQNRKERSTTKRNTSTTFCHSIIKPHICFHMKKYESLVSSLP